MVNVYQLNLAKQGMDVIVAALAELPYKHAKPVLDECMRQFMEQEAAAEKAAATPTADSKDTE